MTNFVGAFFRIAKRLLFAIALVLALFLIALSNGRVLDLRIGLIEGSATLLAISLVCWCSFLTIIYKTFLGNWRESYYPKFALLGATFFIPLYFSVLFFGPAETPRLAQALMAGMCAFIAVIAADKVTNALQSS